MQTRKKAKLTESSEGFQNLLENLHQTREGRTADCGEPESSTLVDASRKDVGKLLERVGDRQASSRKRKETTSVRTGSCSLGSKKHRSLIQGENALFYQRQLSETRLSESDFHNLPSCGVEAKTNLDSEPRRKCKDESHVNGDATKPTSVEERHDNLHVHMESENNMDGDGFDWEDGNIASCEGTMHAHTSQWNGDLIIEVEDDDTSKQGKKRPIRRATARDKEFAELVHKVHLLCLIGRGMLVNSVCYDPLIQASLYSIVPPHLLNLANEQKLTANMLTPVIKWFQNAFHVQSYEESSSTQHEESKTFVTKLLHCIESRTGTIEEVAALSVALLRVLGLTTRYVSILDVAPIKPDTESLDASADWNSDTDTENGSIPHMNTTKITTASLGQILARCPSQLSPQNRITEDRGGTECHESRGCRSKRGGDSGNGIPQEKSSEVSYTGVESADGGRNHAGIRYGNSEVTFSEGQEKGIIKRKGDLEFERELAMALSATAVEAQSKVNNENNFSCKERHGTTYLDMPASTSERRHDIRKSRLSARQKNAAVWSRKLLPYLYWAEVYCEGETLTGRWVHVDAANGVVDGEHKVEEAAAACKRPLRYVLAFAGNGAKDVTRRYASKWSAIAPHRVSSQWWEATMSPLKELEAAASAEALDMKTSQEKKEQSSTHSPGINHQGCSNENVGSEDLVKLEASQVCDKSTENDGKKLPQDGNCISLETQDYKAQVTDLSSLEDMELETRTFTEPLPTNQQAYKSHHLYVLERWLTKYQTLYPKGPVLGFCAGQPVYPRTCVQNLHTSERWLREGFQIKKGEVPAKVVKALRNLAKEYPSSPTLLEEDCLQGRSTALFGKWQTEPLQLLPAVGGIVPKNERGHVDVWSEKCLPPGTVHLRMQRLVPVAKRLGIDFSPAMVGFEIRNGRSVPIFEGIVICEEFRDAILQAHSEEAEKREIEEKKKNEHQAVSRWNQLLRSIATRLRLQNAYEETYSNTVLSDLRAVDNIDSVAKTSTSTTNNAFEERRGDVLQVGSAQGNTHSLEQKNNDFTNTYETIKDLKSVSMQNHTHIFPAENQSYDEESAIWTKCCPCGFSIQVEEM